MDLSLSAPVMSRRFPSRSTATSQGRWVAGRGICLVAPNRSPWMETAGLLAVDEDRDVTD
jgi:hypothetical protein